MQVVILAGGRGTRAYPFTEYQPKPMMPVCGKPIIERVMELFALQGVVDFIISVGYRKEVIVGYFAPRVPIGVCRSLTPGRDGHRRSDKALRTPARRYVHGHLQRRAVRC